MAYEPTEGMVTTWDTRRQAWRVYKPGTKQRLMDLPERTEHLTLDDLPDTVAGDQVRLWCERWAAYPETIAVPDRVTGLLLTGPPGSGKTWMACIAANHVSNLGHTTKFISSPNLYWARLHAQDLLRERDEDALAYEELVDGYSKWKAWRLLVLDDLGRERTTNTSYSQSLMEELLRSRYDDAAPTIVTTNLTVSEIWDRYGERTESLLHELFWVIDVSAADQRKVAR